MLNIEEQNLTEFLQEVKVNFRAINNYIEYPKRLIKLNKYV